MEEVHKKILKRKRVPLATDLCADKVLQHLVATDIITDHMVEKINAKSTNFAKNVELLNLLPKRGPKAFQSFIDALDKTDHDHLAQGLKGDDEVELLTISKSCPIRCQLHDPDSFKASSFCFPADDNVQNSKDRFHRHPTISKVATKNDDHEVMNLQSSNLVPSGNSSEQCIASNVSCSNINDILSTKPASALLSAADLAQTKLTVSDNQKLATHKVHSSMHTASDSNADQHNEFTSNCDLTDGPTHDDLIVRPSTLQFQQQHSLESYRMTSNPRGLALIVSVDEFEPSACLDKRQAADIDRARLELVLRQLGFKCYVLLNGTAEEIWNILKKFVSLEDHCHCGISMLVVMSHGENGAFYGRDGEKVEIKQVVDLFSNENCKALQNKPKVLLFQSCRGVDPDTGVDQVDGPWPSKDGPFRVPESDALSRTSSRTSLSSMALQNKLPSRSDCLVGFATVRGYAAMRNTKHGSWFIQALVRALAYHACDKNLLEITTIVNDLIKGREGWSPASEFHRCKEMSIFHSTLCKNVYLFPGL